jgi:hypothetical protein
MSFSFGTQGAFDQGAIHYLSDSVGDGLLDVPKRTGVDLLHDQFLTLNSDELEELISNSKHVIEQGLTLASLEINKRLGIIRFSYPHMDSNRFITNIYGSLSYMPWKKTYLGNDYDGENSVILTITHERTKDAEGFEHVEVLSL